MILEYIKNLFKSFNVENLDIEFVEEALYIRLNVMILIYDV